MIRTRTLEAFEIAYIGYIIDQMAWQTRQGLNKSVGVGKGMV